MKPSTAKSPLWRLKKKDILDKMNSGTCSPEELTELSLRYQETESLLEEKTNRWLDLSELFE